MTRRAMLQAGAAAMLARGQSGNAGAVFAYVGTYTSAERYARGDGIHVYRVNTETGGWTPVQHVDGLVNPSFVALSPDGRWLCSAHGDESYATSFAVDRATGRLTLLNKAASGGRNGVHPAFSPNGRFVIVANYSSGSVGVLPVGGDGHLRDATQVVPLPGQPGPHRIDQASSHPHQVVFDPTGHFVLVPDKGLDRIFVFRFDAEAGTLTPTAQGSVAARAGSGPRHAAFHPTLPVVWVVNEIASTIATYYWEAEHGNLRAVQILPSVPAEFTGESTASEIAVGAGGRFVYCSNRGHDSVAIFSVDASSGMLTSVGWESSRGRVPRFIGFDPAKRFLYAANEQGDTVRCWRASDGRLSATGELVKVASPVAIAFGG